MFINTNFIGEDFSSLGWKYKHVGVMIIQKIKDVSLYFHNRKRITEELQ